MAKKVSNSLGRLIGRFGPLKWTISGPHFGQVPHQPETSPIPQYPDVRLYGPLDVGYGVWSGLGCCGRGPILGPRFGPLK